MNLDFSIERIRVTIIEYFCFYCDGEFGYGDECVRISFENKPTMRVHSVDCWNNFLTGALMINEELKERVN